MTQSPFSPQTERRASESEPQLTIVGIGASAGGLEALEHFFDNMPVDTGMAFVVVQHLSPDFKSLMNELLARHTTMNIHRAEHAMKVLPNSVYLIPPKMNMRLSRGKLTLTEQDHKQGLNLPIDIFFSSMAHEQRDKCVAVVLSGTGSDGSRGIVDVYHAGGLVAVQSAESAGFDGMPKSALKTHVASVVAPAWDLPLAILKGLKEPRTAPEIDEAKNLPSDVPAGEELDAILGLFRRRYQIDFTLYRECTIQRRIDRRIQLVRCRDLADYVTILREDAAELETLYRDLLVEVTQFFRDPQAFERLKTEVVPQILARVQSPREEIRAWVAGCATGEEAYSVAMLMDTCCTEAGVSPTIKVFATDVHRNSLEAGSAGVYSLESLRSVPEDMRKRYFTLNGSLYHVNAELRKMVIFAPHNLSSDPPFTRMDLISCRNVLIYFKPEIQKRILSLFHFGLRVDGVLLLGSSESLGDLSREFETLDQHWRVFRKLRDVRLREAAAIPMSPPLGNNTIVGTTQTPLVGLTRPSTNSFWNVLAEDLLDRYVPPSVVVNEQLEIVHSFGNAREFLVQPKGRSTLEILKMVTGDLRMALSAALHRSTREGERVVLQGVRTTRGDKQVSIQLTVEPFTRKGTTMTLVSMETLEHRANVDEQVTEFRPDDQAAVRIMDLEQELEYKTESLQSTVEELESSNEELQSTNEELVASNEELQSTNEELHSVNEELYTVNAEHQRKIDELTALTADMDNLIRSTEIATIFLDRDLRIRRFTPSITRVFNILPQDIGRPIEQFAYHFESPDWIEKANEVIQTGESQQTELPLRDRSATFLKRVSPFKTASGEIAGVVITFTDVSQVARTKELEERQKHLERVNHDLQEFVYAVSHDMQTPMRHLQDALSSLLETVGDAADSTIRSTVERFDKKVRRLEQMLSSLLHYSRVNTRGKAAISVDSKEIANEVLSEFQPILAKLEGHVSVGELPIIQADAAQFQSLVWHLVDNAIKYSDEPPRLEISCSDQDDKWDFSFRDQGIGILPQHAQSIFVIFRRLGFKPDVLGQGVGLALCKRIAERHQAEIWAEPNASGGTTVHVIWPKTPPPGDRIVQDI